MNKELHIIVIWQNARYKEKEILEDIQKHLKIAECIEIEWNPKNIASNFTRFYGVKLPNRSFKEKECGSGKFLLVTVFDEKPHYEYMETSRGFELVNKNLFELKNKYRSWTRGGHKIHSTNTIQETNHDITLMLGVNYDDYISSAPQKWNGKIKKIKRDITGYGGWKSLEEFFYVLNSTVKYCVLRNYEILPGQFNSDLHGDIDILTDNYSDMVYITNAVPVFKKKYRVHHKVKINNEDVLFDFRFVGDNYYCYEFEENILNNRIINDKNIYIPTKENSFYSLVYHCLIHKREIAKDYYAKVKSLYDAIGLCKEYNIDEYKYPFDLYYEILINYMFNHNYQFTKPQDLSVYFNTKSINNKKIIKWLTSTYDLKNVKPYMLGVFSTESDYQFLTGDLGNKKIFIKWGGYEDSVVTEYKIGKILYETNPSNFIEPLLFNYNNGKNFVATAFTRGCMLSELMSNNNINEKQKTAFIQQLESIANTLEKTGIIHRDIRPDNIMVENGEILKLIDTQFATNLSKFKPQKLSIKYLYNLRFIGDKYRFNLFCWDDMYSINKIITELNGQSNLIEEKIGKNVLNLAYLKILFFIIKVPQMIYCKLKKY